MDTRDLQDKISSWLNESLGFWVDDEGPRFVVENLVKTFGGLVTMKWTLQDLRDTAAMWLRKASEANDLDVADVVAQLAADLTTIDKIQEVIYGPVEMARTMSNLSNTDSAANGQPKEPLRDSHGNTVPAGTLDAMGQGIAFIKSSAK